MKNTHTDEEYYSAIKKNEIIPFAATQMDVEIIAQSEARWKTKDKYMVTYMWNQKNDTNELTYKMETDPQTQKTNLWLPEKKGGEG